MCLERSQLLARVAGELGYSQCIQLSNMYCMMHAVNCVAVHM